MYREYSTIYDFVREGKRIDTQGLWINDGQFWLNKAVQSKGPVLEFACGTGRLTIPIAETGISIHGVDNSPEMLVILQDKIRRKPREVQQRVTYELASMEESLDDLKNQFSLAFVAASSLQYLHTRSQHQAFFENARDALTPGGYLVVDVFNPNPNLVDEWGKPLLMTHRVDTPRKGDDIKWFATPLSFNTKTKVVSMPSSFEINSSDPSLPKRMTVAGDYYCFDKDELIDLFIGSGFRNIKVSGNYDKKEYAKDSPRIVMEAEAVNPVLWGTKTSDFDEILELVKKSFPRNVVHRALGVLEMHKQCVESGIDDGRRYYKAVENGKIVGVYGIQKRNEDPDDLFWGAWAFIDPSKRGLLLGWRMWKDFLEIAQTKGYKRMYCETTDDNSEYYNSKPYLERLGFKEVSRIPGYHDQGVDLVILAGKLDELKH